ncbi:hypothetical protein K440DRAFT_547506 [Wilcoxina mikolae CBS 423.85]|nr:hypothetical protein K440DRAFT_547506 [Wilcoxina mikolae CBS 423.85]
MLRIVYTTLPVGDTLVPMILMSGGTYLTNYSGDKKVWLIYMTFGNLSAAAQIKYTKSNMLLVGLLSIPMKMREISLKRINVLREHNRMVSQNVLQNVLQYRLNSETRTFYAHSDDGNFMHCDSILAAGMADYSEQSDFQNIKDGIWY